MSGPVVPHFPLTVASEPVNPPPLNRAVGDVAGQPVVSPLVNPPVDKSAGRPVQRRKRSRVAIEA